MTTRLAESLAHCTMLVERAFGEWRRELFLYIPFDGVQALTQDGTFWNESIQAPFPA